jgi:putative transposase
MRAVFEFAVHCLITLFTLLKPGGVKAIASENIMLRQQLIVVQRKRKRAPNLSTSDRFIFGLLCSLISPNRLRKIAIIVKPTTFLKLHKALVNRKYRLLYSNKITKKPGRKPPSQALIDLVLEMKRRNPNYGYRRISMQILQSFGIKISCFAVGRILRKYYKSLPSGGGPSWLTFIGHMQDSLWSVDLFRCESIHLRSHWVMVVIDQFTRRIIGFAVYAGDPHGIAVCCMFNELIARKALPKYLISDNDPLFEFHRWQANLRIIDVEEIKSIPGCPTSNPFVERVIGTCRREILDHTLFWNERDLLNKLNEFKKYYNQTRGHWSLNSSTPAQKANFNNTTQNIANLENYRWKKHCRGLFQTPMAA